MEKEYNLKEIFDIAIQIEVNGAKFYRDLAEKQTIPAVKKFLLDLAEQEGQHENIFIRLQRKFVDDGNESELLGDDFAKMYMQAEAANYIFKSAQSDVINENMLLGDILELAMNKERDSILFFMGLKFAMKQPADKEIIDHLINEEQLHLATLAQFRAEYGN